jgi:hypothetical protein
VVDYVQQAVPGSHGIIRIHVWSGFVTSERKEEEEELCSASGVVVDYVQPVA